MLFPIENNYLKVFIIIIIFIFILHIESLIAPMSYTISINRNTICPSGLTIAYNTQGRTEAGNCLQICVRVYYCLFAKYNP